MQLSNIVKGRWINVREFEAAIARNGKMYPQVMGKFQTHMHDIPPKHWVQLVEIIGKKMNDADAKRMDEIIEGLRCSQCNQIGRACQCE